MTEFIRLEDGKVAISLRGATYQARIYLGPKDNYIWRSLGTSDEAEARKRALKIFMEIGFRQQHGLPVKSRAFRDVVDEYVRFREKEHEQGRTSASMLRQIKRVSKFWREFGGAKPVENIGDAELKDYLQWRQAYYSHVPPDQLHPNAKLNPTEKTLQWDISLGTTIIRWAHEKGYRGNKPLPTFTFTPKKKRVRPAFELGDYRKLTRALLAWEKECPNPEFLHTRQLLRDYVLILANSGMRTGEANNLRIRDVTDFTDGAGRRNVRFIVRGKTGERSVIPRLNAAAYVNRLLERRKGAKLDDWLFIMKDGSQVTNLIDQFNKVLERADMLTNSAGQKFTLYSLRHFYAVMGLRNGIGIYDIARNMGTSVQMIEQYYGKQATPEVLATALGGKAFPERDPKPTNAPAAP